MKKTAIFALFFLVLLSLSVEAANVKGTVYGPSFNIEDNVLVRASSDRGVVQSVASKDGTYSFNLQDGKYLLEAEVFEEGELTFSGKEEIDVGNEDLTIDLVVFPSSEDIPDDFELNDLDIENRNSLLPFIAAIIILGVAVYSYMKRMKGKKNKEKLPKDLEEIIKVIEKHGRRISQIDLRKELPYSEAKVSLMVTDLESRGLIKRVKKGRGNVLMLD